MIGKDQDKKARDEMRALDTMILQKGMKSFHTATPKLDKMTGNDGRQESSADDAELRAHGYELKWDDADNDEWQPFFKVCCSFFIYLSSTALTLHSSGRHTS